MSKCHIVGNHVSRLNCASTDMQLSSAASGLYSSVYPRHLGVRAGKLRLGLLCLFCSSQNLVG